MLADHDAGLAVDALEQGRADGDVARAADDGVVGHDAEGREEGVHGAAHAVVEAGLAAEDLRQRAVEHEVDGQVTRSLPPAPFSTARQGPPAHVGLHDPGQLGIVQLVDGREALGQDLAVAAVRAEDEVLGVQVQALADRRRFLPDGQVRRPLVVVLDALVLPLGLDRGQHGLELADEQHVLVDLGEALLAVLFFLFLGVRHVLVHQQGGKLDFPRLAHHLGVDDDRFGHGLFSFRRPTAGRGFRCSGPVPPGSAPPARRPGPGDWRSGIGRCAGGTPLRRPLRGVAPRRASRRQPLRHRAPAAARCRPRPGSPPAAG